MPSLPVFESAAEARVAAVVKEIELATSAEVVVVLRISSGYYRHTDYLLGSFAGLLSVLAFLFHPQPFDVRIFPLAFVLSYAAGALLSSRIEPLRRALTRQSILVGNVTMAARAAFVEHGVSRTTARTGLLVYVSVFERRVELVADVGIDESALGDEYRSAKSALQKVLAASLETSVFESALRAVASPLAATLPRAADDVNELADEVRS